jgi:hypothetical protein
MNNSPANIEADDNFDLKLKINVVKAEIEKVKLELNEFEVILRNFVLDDMIEEQELATKYRNFQKAKKAKRQAQKRKGKNYKEPTGIVKTKPSPIQNEPDEQKALRKKLYRETMLLVHPDRVGGDERYKETATEVTSKLVEIYNSGDLDELQLFCAHIEQEQVSRELDFIELKDDIDASSAYYENELQKYEMLLQELRSKHTYEVLTTYERPIDFAQELKDYYKDRIEKLKKRTRKVK